LVNGYLEKIYENALMMELAQNKIPAEQQVPLPVHYRGQILGDFFVDIVVYQKIILELKAANNLSPINEAQLLHYLKSSGMKVGYLLNFGAERKLQFKRLVF